MLKKILNKNLLVALVIGGSLGLTNAGMCTSSTISCYGKNITGFCGSKSIVLNNDQVCKIPERALLVQSQLDQIFAYCGACEKTTPTSFYIINGTELLTQGDITGIGWEQIVEKFPKLSKDNVVCCGAVNNSLKSSIVKGLIDSLKEQCRTYETPFGVETYGSGAAYYYCVRTLTEDEKTEKTAMAKDIQELKNSVNGFKATLDKLGDAIKLLAPSEDVNNREKALRLEIKNVTDGLSNTVRDLQGKIVALEERINGLRSEMNNEIKINKNIDEMNNHEKEEENRRQKETLEKFNKEILEKERIENEKIEREAKMKREEELRKQREEENRRKNEEERRKKEEEEKNIITNSGSSSEFNFSFF